MFNLSERILGGLELVFWRLTVQLLSIARPISKSVLINAKDQRDAVVPIRERFSFPFSRNLFSALLGWGTGILFGYFLTIWII